MQAIYVLYIIVIYVFIIHNICIFFCNIQAQVFHTPCLSVSLNRAYNSSCIYVTFKFHLSDQF